MSALPWDDDDPVRSAGPRRPRDEAGSEPAIRRGIRAAAAKRFCMPRQSSDLNPIEQSPSKVRALLRKVNGSLAAGGHVGNYARCQHNRIVAAVFLCRDGARRASPSCFWCRTAHLRGDTPYNLSDGGGGITQPREEEYETRYFGCGVDAIGPRRFGTNEHRKYGRSPRTCTVVRRSGNEWRGGNRMGDPTTGSQQLRNARRAETMSTNAAQSPAILSRQPP